jgi:hypothetical protein
MALGAKWCYVELLPPHSTHSFSTYLKPFSFFALGSTVPLLAKNNKDLIFKLTALNSSMSGQCACPSLNGY